MPDRKIRVHLPGTSTFIVETSLGLVVRCTRPLDPALGGGDNLVGRTEADVADELRKLGATFVDLGRERQQMRVRRGYRAREDRVVKPKAEQLELVPEPKPEPPKSIRDIHKMMAEDWPAVQESLKGKEFPF